MTPLINCYHYNTNKDLWTGPIWSPDNPDCAQTYWSSHSGNLEYPSSYEDNQGENSIIWKLIQRGKDLPETITDYNPSYRWTYLGQEYSLSNLYFRRGEKEVLYSHKPTDRCMIYCRGVYLWFYSPISHTRIFQTWGYYDLQGNSINTKDKQFTVSVTPEGKYFYYEINAYMTGFGLKHIDRTDPPDNAYCYLTGIKFDADF